MFKNSSKIMFLLILMLGTLITISSTSWLGAWMGLEINLLAFIPLMTTQNNLMSTEASLKYFLTQALASSMLLFSIILSMTKFNTIPPLFHSISIYSYTIMVSSLLVKSGAAPFHFWFPMVMEGLSWINALLLMTWQKIAPLMLLSYLIMNSILMMTAITSIIMGALGGLNQTSLRKLMAFSSINHLGWMISAMSSNENLWINYFLFYSLLSTVVISMFILTKMMFINQLFFTPLTSNTMKFCMFTNLLSLGGLPPFIGFLPKWLVIQHLTNNNQMFLMFIMVVFTLITLFFYLRLCYSAFTLAAQENHWKYKAHLQSTNTNNTIMMLTSMSLMGLFPAMTLFNYF